jgi:hypothetical protein
VFYERDTSAGFHTFQEPSRILKNRRCHVKKLTINSKVLYRARVLQGTLKAEEEHCKNLYFVHTSVAVSHLGISTQCCLGHCGIIYKSIYSINP